MKPEIIAAFRSALPLCNNAKAVEDLQDRTWVRLGMHDAVENTIVGQEGSKRRGELKRKG